MGILKKGLVQIYTGTGKGKTTAALGLAWRMLGRGGRVYICQFLKPANSDSGESRLAQKMSGVLRFDQLAEPWDMRKADDPGQCERMRAAIGEKLREIHDIVMGGDYDLVILDEIVFCLAKGLIKREDVEGIMADRAGHVELVLTGRGADEALKARADLVTEMQSIKHPYEREIPARAGIEY